MQAQPQQITTIFNYLLSLLGSNFLTFIIFFTIFIGLAIVGYLSKKFQEIVKVRFDSIFGAIKDKFTGGINPQTIEKIHQIQLELAEMRTRLNASRCFIVEIHNGETFLSG